SAILTEPTRPQPPTRSARKGLGERLPHGRGSTDHSTRRPAGHGVTESTSVRRSDSLPATISLPEKRMFDALYLEKTDAGFSATRRSLSEDELKNATPDADVTLRVEYSALNYKDALALTNRSPVVRRWPMVPGIDGAGIVEESTHAGFAPGDRVILNGWGVGETHRGASARRHRRRAGGFVRLPAGLATPGAMGMGTAGSAAGRA